jgi:hypothetical protein
MSIRHFCLAIFGAGSVWGAEDSPQPTPLSPDRYAAMAEQSPFALATAPAPASTPQASFAANWFVSGIARVGDTDFVTIRSRDASVLFSLFGREPNQGVSLASVDWSGTVGKTTVVLQKGTETARLEFNEAELRAQPAEAAAPMKNPGAPPPGAGQPPGKGAMPWPAGTQPAPQAAPGPVIPWPGFPPPSANPQQPPQVAPPPFPIVTPQGSGQKPAPPNVNPAEIRRRGPPISVPK